MNKPLTRGNVRLLRAIALASPGMVTDRILAAALSRPVHVGDQTRQDSLKMCLHHGFQRTGDNWGVHRVRALGYRMMEADAKRFLAIYGYGPGHLPLVVIAGAPAQKRAA